MTAFANQKYPTCFLPPDVLATHPMTGSATPRAGTQTRKSASLRSLQAPGHPNTTSSERNGGWTVGGGVEYAFDPFVSAGADYNFARINIADRNQSVNPGFA